MKKFKLLLLDANIVIEIFRLGLWDKIVDRCEVSLAQTVIDESNYFEDNSGNKISIDLSPWLSTHAITVINQTPSDLDAFRNLFDPEYSKRMDAGETESLSFLMGQKTNHQLCSADHIVFRILGNLNREDQGISLEEILSQIGLTHKLEYKYSRAFREHWTKKGFQDALSGAGIRKKP